MKNRLSFAAHLIDQGFQTEQLILLTGERYITVGIDGTEPELQAIAKEFGLSDVKKLTETHLLRHAYQESSLAQCALCVPAGSAPAGSAPAGSAPAGSATPWSVHIIDTPRRDLPRPTTETTAVDLAAWLKTQPQIRRVIFVSNQPYVAYQRAVLQAVFTREYPACAITVVGQAADATEPPQTLVEALGGTIWAAMPAAMHKLKITVTEPQARAALETLYKKNPLIFSQLPKFD
jgi:hypothetical protein